MKRRGFLKLFGLGTAAAVAAPLVARTPAKAFTDDAAGFHDDAADPESLEFYSRAAGEHICGGSDGTILTSPDGITWTERRPPEPR